MSRIGKKLIKIPQGVEITVEGQRIKVKGPRGELEKTLPGVLMAVTNDSFIEIRLKDESVFDKENSRLWGLGRALVAVMVEGVSNGFEKMLEFNGIGFKAQVKGDSIELNLGYSNPVIIQAPMGVIFHVEKNTIKISGIDKEKVGQAAALIRSARPPEPYKGTGIKYKDEVIIRKAGKKAVATAG